MLAAGQASGAIDLLTTNRPDTLAPQYLYWRGRALENKDDAAAVKTYAQMWQTFPDSPKALDATIREASAFARLEQWKDLERLLTQTNGVFQYSLRSRAVSETMASGFLLLGEAQFAQGKFADVESTLRVLEAQPKNTQLKWQRDYLASRLQRA